MGVNHDLKIDTEMRMAYKQTNTYTNSDFLTNKREVSDSSHTCVSGCGNTSLTKQRHNN